jgi:hypothetical protein
MENKNEPTYEWKDIGIVEVDTGNIIIADPMNVLTHREFEELRVKEKIAKLPLYTDFKHGIVSKTGFGEGRYHTFAKIVDFGNSIKRITEIRIIFDATNNNDNSQKMLDSVIKEKNENVLEKRDDLSKGVKIYSQN